MVKWGIVGLGQMANHFANAIKKVNDVKILGIASKSKLKLEKFSVEHNIPKDCLFNDYKKLIESNSVDAIYISTLNNTHIDLIHECIENNKNILCEKPMGLNANEVENVFNKLKETKIYFYEAIAYRAHPQTFELLRLIKEGEIGEVKKVEATFGFKVRKIDKKSRLFNKDLGGGAILDLGCYPISFYNLFSSNQNEQKFISSKGSFSITGIDDYAEINLLDKKNIELFAKISLKENLENKCIIYGSKGIIQVPTPWLPQKKSYLEIIKKNSYYKKFINTDKNIYTIQIENVSKIFSKAKSLENSLLVNVKDSVNIMKTLDLWRSKINE